MDLFHAIFFAFMCSVACGVTGWLVGRYGHAYTHDEPYRCSWCGKDLS